MSVELFMKELVNAMSYDDVHALLKASPRLAREFDHEVFEAFYKPIDAIPSQVLEPLATYAFAPVDQEELLWRGEMETGTFTLETPNRSYLLRGRVQYGDLDGTFHAVLDNTIVLSGSFSNNKPNGTFHMEDIDTSMSLSKEVYVDGLKQGTSEYYYDITKDASQGVSYKMYEVDYVNDESVHERKYDA